MSRWPYYTARWRKLRETKLLRKPVCEHCELVGNFVWATVVDHITPISQGGKPFPALSGLQSLCQTCHNRKTGSDKSGQDHTVRGYDLDGNPIDPSHAWHGGPDNHGKQDGRRPMPPTNEYLVSNSDDDEDVLWV